MMDDVAVALAGMWIKTEPHWTNMVSPRAIMER